MENAVQAMASQYHCAIICKGGHLEGCADDLLYSGGAFEWFRGKRVLCQNNHGTGCTYSSAFASALALGRTLSEAAAFSKGYMAGALSDGLDIGQGNGPLNHFWRQYGH